MPLGRIEEALHELRAAEKADPLSSQIHSELAYTLLSAGRYDEAASQCEKMPVDAENRNECLGRARMGQGRMGEAIPLLAASPNWGYLAYAYAKAGRRGEAEKLMAEAPTLYPDHSGAFQFALAFAGLGDKDRAMEKLDRMAVLGPVRLGVDLTYPEFALLRGNPRVKALRKKVPAYRSGDAERPAAIFAANRAGIAGLGFPRVQQVQCNEHDVHARPCNHAHGFFRMSPRNSKPFPPYESPGCFARTRESAIPLIAALVMGSWPPRLSWRMKPRTDFLAFWRQPWMTTIHRTAAEGSR